MGMPTTITKYRITFWGGTNGFGDLRAIIRLYNGQDVVSEVRFLTPGTDIPADYTDSIDRVQMHFPLSMFPNVLDVLRNERPILIDNFFSFSASLGTETEPIGEAE
jgi:hypothetical protein